MTDDSLAQALDRVAVPLRRLAVVTYCSAALALAAAGFAVAAWVGRASSAGGPGWAIAAWTLLIVVAAALTIALQRGRPRHAAPAIGGALERTGAWRRGALVTVIDESVQGTSVALHELALRQRAGEVAARAAGALQPLYSTQRRFAGRSIAALGLSVLLLAAARPDRESTALLWHPVDAVKALVAPVELRARSGVVPRGTTATFEVRAIGRRRATLFIRAPGESWRTQTIELDASGRGSFTTAPLTSDLIAHAEAGGRSSAEVHVALRLSAFLGSWIALARYPSYLGLEDETLATTGDTLILPEGTTLRFTGRVTTPLTSAELRRGSERIELPVDGGQFTGTFTPRDNGSWTLHVATKSGAPLESDPPPLPIRIVPDSAPAVEIAVPGVDTIASPSLALGLVISVRDDHGISAAFVESRHGSGEIQRTPIELGRGIADRALLTTSLDLKEMGLRAGDTLRYRAVAEDNAPARHQGRSREFMVRIPTESEQRAAQQNLTGSAAHALDSLSQQAGRAQRTAEDLSRERAAGAQRANNNASDEPGKNALASDAARKAQSVADAQQKLLDDAARVQQQVNELQRAAERGGASDSSLARQLREINQLLDKALSPEMRAQLEQLKQAVKSLDAEGTQEALHDLAAQQARLKDAIDQARELFKRAALETQLSDLGHQASDIADQQRKLTPQLAHGDSSKTAQAESVLGQRADSLAAQLERAASQVAAPRPQQGLQHAAQQARDAASHMQQSAKASQAGQKAEAEQQAKDAQQQLDPLSHQIDDNRQQVQAEMRAEVKLALQRALEETAHLADRQLQVARAFQQGALLSQSRADQGLVEEGATKLAQQLRAVSAMNALVSPQAGVALAEARTLMQQAVAAVSSANPNPREAYEKAGDAVDALAVAAFSLLQSKDRVNGSKSGSGVQEAMQQMQQMAGRQGQLAQQGSSMMQGGGVNAQQLLQLAMQQRALAQQLDRMRAGGQLPGAGQLSREAQELARSLEAGRLNQDVVQRQQQLFRHMLDAGRTLQGEEDDEKKERQSTTAKDAPVAIPAALDPRIKSGAGDVKLPPWETLQRLSPEERRRVVEYFQRLTQPPPP